MRERGRIMMMMNMYISLLGENIQESKYGRVDEGGWVVGR